MPVSELFEVIILGIVQGIAEFLPISSSGHLVILQKPLQQFLDIHPDNQRNLDLNVALHLGTLFSILTVYRSDIRNLANHPRICWAILLATIPVALVGLTLKDWFESAFQTPLVAGISLLVTAFLLLIGQRWERGELTVESIPLPVAFIIGLFQAFALIPGISRSGSTIAGGLLSGLQRDSAATFSFFIAIPAIGGASAMLVKDIWQGHSGGSSLLGLATGAAVSFLVGLLALRFLLKVITQRRLHWFAYYCIFAGTATLLWQVVNTLSSP